MAHAMRDLAGIIMVNPPVGSEPWSRSRASIANVTDLLLKEISQKQKRQIPPLRLRLPPPKISLPGWSSGYAVLAGRTGSMRIGYVVISPVFLRQGERRSCGQAQGPSTRSSHIRAISRGAGGSA